MKDIGYRIAQYRKARGLTQTELAEKLGVVKQTVGNYERGEREPSHEAIKQIAQILDVPYWRILGVQDASNARTFGERLTNYMLLNSDTLVKLSLALDRDIEEVSRMCVNDLEPTARDLRIIADRYDISVDQLVYEGDSDKLLYRGLQQAKSQLESEEEEYLAGLKKLSPSNRQAVLALVQSLAEQKE